MSLYINLNVRGDRLVESKRATGDKKRDPVGGVVSPPPSTSKKSIEGSLPAYAKVRDVTPDLHHRVSRCIYMHQNKFASNAESESN